MQVGLLWAWYSLHARRLRDAGTQHRFGTAARLVYALAVVLLVLLSGLARLRCSGATGTNADILLARHLLLLVVLAEIRARTLCRSDLGSSGVILGAGR